MLYVFVCICVYGIDCETNPLLIQVADPPDPDLQSVRPVCQEVRCQHPPAPPGRLRRQQGPDRRRRVQGLSTIWVPFLEGVCRFLKGLLSRIRI